MMVRPMRRLGSCFTGSAKRRMIRRTRPLGGENKVVETDETYIGGKEGNSTLGSARRWRPRRQDAGRFLGRA